MGQEFSSGLFAGVNAMRVAQDINTTAQDRRRAELERRYTEAGRGIEAVVGNDDLETVLKDPDRAQALTDIFNQNSDILLQRPGGLAKLRGFVPTGKGAAAVVDVHDPQTGELKSTGPITKNGTSDDNDPVVTVNSKEDLLAPIRQNLQFLRSKNATLNDKLTANDQAGKLNRAREAFYSTAAAEAPAQEPTTTRTSTASTLSSGAGQPQVNGKETDFLTKVSAARDAGAAKEDVINSIPAIARTPERMAAVDQVYGAGLTEDELNAEPPAPEAPPEPSTLRQGLHGRNGSHDMNARRAQLHAGRPPLADEVAGLQSRLDRKHGLRNGLPDEKRTAIQAQIDTLTNPERLRAEIARLEAEPRGGGRGSGNRRKGNADRIAQLQAQLDHLEGRTVESEAPAQKATEGTAEEANPPAPPPPSKTQELIQNTPAPSSPKAIEATARTITETAKPAKRMSPELVKAAIELRKLGGFNKMGDADFADMLQRGRLTKDEWQTAVTSAGDVVQSNKAGDLRFGTAPLQAQATRDKLAADKVKAFNERQGKLGDDAKKGLEVRQKTFDLVQDQATAYAAEHFGDDKQREREVGKFMRRTNGTPFLDLWGIDASRPEQFNALWEANQAANAYERGENAGVFNSVAQMFGKDETKVDDLGPFLAQSFAPNVDVPQMYKIVQKNLKLDRRGANEVILTGIRFAQIKGISAEEGIRLAMETKARQSQGQ